MLRKIAVLLSLLAVSGCAASPGYQAAMLMKQQREAGEVLMVKCRAGDVAACAHVAGDGIR
jgi:hypothetical protein